MPKSKITLTSNAKALRDDLRRRKRALDAQITARAQALEPQALGLLVVGLNATVYGTEAGAYQRTEDLLRGAHATVKRRRRGVVEVNVWNTEPYALFVEYGVQEDRVSQAQGQQRAGLPGAQPSPLVTGRSGIHWTQPSLAHTRALVWTMERLRLDVKAMMARIFR